jgi:hypothetical protein
LITHCSPVADKSRWRWMVGAAIATIVWSIDIIATAKIIAVRTRYRLTRLTLLLSRGTWLRKLWRASSFSLV